MNNIKFTSDLIEKAQNNFANIQTSIQGLYNILKILSCETEDDLLCSLGIENLSNLYQNYLELMLNDYGMRQIVKKIRDAEIDLDISLDDCDDCAKING